MKACCPVGRFLCMVSVANSCCWEWQGCLNEKGYGLFFHDNYYRAHRFSYEYYNNAIIPEGLTIDHLCRNRKCVNPKHLEIVTNKENVLRGVGLTAINAKVTHCPYGHPYDSENTYITVDGRRNCKQCHRDSDAKWRHNRKVLTPQTAKYVEAII